MAKINTKWINDEAITEAKLDINNSPTVDYVLAYNSDGRMKWVTNGAGADSKDFKVSSNDTTPGFVEDKITSGDGITATTNNDGANETREISLNIADTNIFQTTITDVDTHVPTSGAVVDYSLKKSASSVDGELAVWNGTGGDELKTTGYNVETTLTDDDSAIPTSGSIFDYAVALSGAQTISGVKTFSSIPVLPASDPTSGNEAVRKSYVDNLISGITWKEPVINITTSTPPGTPTTGDRYIVAATASGDWTGEENNIAEWNGSAWVFTTAVANMAVFDESTDKGYTYDADTTTWVQFSTSNIQSASTTSEGIVELATEAETKTKSDATRVVTPSSLSDFMITDDASSTNTAIVVEDGTSGKKVKGTLATVDASGSINIPTGQKYKINGTDLSSSDIGAIAEPSSLAQGDVLYYNGSSWVKLAAGTNGQVLTTAGAGANPSWETNTSGEIKKVEVLTLNATNISNAYIDLAQIPATASAVEVTPVGGISQEYTTDFTIISDGSDVKRLNWGSLGMDGVLADGDKIIVSYTYTN